MRKPFWKGLGTIDLAIIFSIICIVSAIVFWRYDDFKCRAMQSEAKFSLNEVYAAQQSYHAKHNRFAPIETLMDSEKLLVLPKRYYTLTNLIKPTATNFAIAAVGVQGSLVAGERWTVNQNQDLVLEKSRCVHE